MGPEHASPDDYPFPARKEEKSIEVNEVHLDVLRTRLKRYALEYAFLTYQQDGDYESYLKKSETIKSASIVFDDRIQNIGGDEFSYIRYIREFIAPEKRPEMIDYIESELEKL